VAAPSTPADAKGLLKTAIRLDDPVIFVEHKSLYLETGPVPDDEHLVPFGVADVKRPGRDVTIVAWGKMVPMSLRAAEALEADGIDAEVLDIRTLVPLDEEAILRSVRRTGRAVVVTEGHRRGTYAAEIAATIAEHAYESLQAPVRRVAALDVPLPMAPNLEPLILPQVEWIADAARASLGGPADGPLVTGEVA
jgi:pyruvate dehydrogenase E1 component beta subunit